MKKEIYTLVGIAASGKSTFAEALIRKTLMDEIEVPMPRNWVDPTCYLNADDIRKELYGDPTIQGDGAVVFAILRDRLKSALTDNTTRLIIIDNTSLTYKIRKRYYELAATTCPRYGHTFDYNLVFFKPDLQRSLEWNQKRDRHVPDDVIKSQFERYSEATDKEKGYAKIIEVNHGTSS